jgi:hypothetical protein
MRVITAVAQRIVALYLGEKIADGVPDSVTRTARDRGLPRPGVRVMTRASAPERRGARRRLRRLPGPVASGDGRSARARSWRCWARTARASPRLMNTDFRPDLPACRAYHLPCKRIDGLPRIARWARGWPMCWSGAGSSPSSPCSTTCCSAPTTLPRVRTGTETLAAVERLFPIIGHRRGPAGPHALRRGAADGGDRPRAHGAARGSS